MPLLIPQDDSDNFKTAAGGGSFAYSGVKLVKLGASEYTIVCLVADTSGSVAPFAAEIEAGVKSVVESCRQSPRADNLMLRFVTFNDRETEHHGYKLLADCRPEDYTGTIRCGGTTALYDTNYNAVESVRGYGSHLCQGQMMVNALLVVITDGADIGSIMTPASIKKSLAAVGAEEQLESLVTILIGVNVKGAVKAGLEAFTKEVGYSQFVPLDDASPKTLARLAGFVAKSISSQSQSLGTGGPSQALSF